MVLDKGRTIHHAWVEVSENVIESSNKQLKVYLAEAYYQQALQLCEQLRKANPGSAEAARDVSLSLHGLSDLLVQGGQGGDAEQALSHYQQALHLREQLRKDNPGSAEAARDVSASLLRLGNFLARPGQAGDAEKALGYYQQALQLCEQLRTDNPGSAQAARDVYVSRYHLMIFFNQKKDLVAADTHAKEAFAILESFAREGRPMDAQMRAVHAQLKGSLQPARGAQPPPAPK